MPKIAGLRFTGKYLPMSAVAGDFYDILPLASGRTLVVVADVSGHGMPAALIASMVKIAVAAEADRFDTPGLTEAQPPGRDECFGDAELRRVLASTPARADLLARC